MYRFLLPLFILTHLMCFSAEASSWTYVNTIVTNLNSDSIKDTIILSYSSQPVCERVFNHISVSITGFEKKKFTALTSWDKVDANFLKKNRNDVMSDQLFVKKSEKQTVILLFGWLSGAGYREEFTILNIVDNRTELVFDRLQEDVDVELPTTITDLDSNGTLDFIFTAYREVTGLGADVPITGIGETYCPFWVYTVDSACVMNKLLTKSYNEEHYCFAGFDYDEHIIAVRPDHGKMRAYTRDKNGKLIWLTD